MTKRQARTSGDDPVAVVRRRERIAWTAAGCLFTTTVLFVVLWAARVDVAGGSVQWGTVAEWATAVVAGPALAVTAFQVVAERREFRQEQLARQHDRDSDHAAMADQLHRERTRQSEAVHTTLFSIGDMTNPKLRVTIRNTSTEPISGISVEAWGDYGDGERPLAAWGFPPVAADDEVTQDFPLPASEPPREWPPITRTVIGWTDLGPGATRRTHHWVPEGTKSAGAYKRRVDRQDDDEIVAPLRS